MQPSIRAVEGKSHVSHEPGSPRKLSSVWIFLALFFLIFVWSLNYVVAKVGLRELPPLALGSFRLVLAGIVSLPVLFFFKSAPRRVRAAQGNNIQVTVEVSRRNKVQALWTITYLDFLNIVPNQGSYMVGLNYPSVSHSSVIIGAAP